MNRLLQGIENETSMRRLANPPADDQAREHAAHSLYLGELMARQTSARFACSAMIFEAAMLEREQRLGPLQATSHFNSFVNA